MIARKTNSQTMPIYCIQRHQCLCNDPQRYYGASTVRCPLHCSYRDFTQRTGDVYARLDAEKAAE